MTDEHPARRRAGGRAGSVHVTANARSTPAAVPIALGDGSLRRSKLVVLVDELGRIVGVVIRVIEIVFETDTQVSSGLLQGMLVATATSPLKSNVSNVVLS